MRAWLFVLVGCGRIAFDESGGDAGLDAITSDARTCTAPVGHDEDGDGIDDACDGCPHLTDPEQPDADGDQVDDACDPRPDVAGESIGFFSSFAAADPRFNSDGAAPSYGNDNLVAHTVSSGRVLMRTPKLPVPATYIVGGRITAVGQGTRQLSLGANNPNDEHTYYCELQGGATSMKLGMTYSFDGTSYIVMARSDGPPLAVGNYQLSISDAYPQLECATTWNVPNQHLVETLPAGLDATTIGFGISGLDVRVRWFVAIVHGI